MKKKQSSVNRKSYSQISFKKRQTLVSCVIDSGKSLTKVAKKLKIKLSTAKLILKKFRNTGILFNKKLRNAKKEPNNRVSDSLNQQSYPIIPILNKQRFQPVNHEYILNVFPEVISSSTGANLFLNNYLQTQWGWSWFYYIN